jgi:hypothetical protein
MNVSCTLRINEHGGTTMLLERVEYDPLVPILVGDQLECAYGSLRVIGRRLSLSIPCWPETIAVSHVEFICEPLPTRSKRPPAVPPKQLPGPEVHD